MAECIEYPENIAFSNGRYGQSESAVSGSRSDYDSQSAENGREDSSNSSDGNTNQESCATKRQSYEQYPCKIQVPKQEDPSLSKPDIILNFGLSRKGPVKVRFKSSASGVSPGVVSASMDESEVIKEKKKKSNRLSLRKQQECERLEAEAIELNMKNFMLKDELIRLSGECMEQENKNNALMENLIKKYGRDAIASLQAKNPDCFSIYQ